MTEIVLHVIEKKIIASLQSDYTQTFDSLVSSTGLSPDQARRGIEWLRHKKLVHVRESDAYMISLDEYGSKLPGMLLPERYLLEMIKDGPQSLSELQVRLGPSAGAALGVVKKNGWVRLAPAAEKNGGVTLNATKSKPPELLPGEATLQKLAKSDGSMRLDPGHSIDESDLEALLRRPRLVKKTTVTTKHVTLDAQRAQGLAVYEDKNTKGAIDVGAAVPDMMAGRTHPLKDVISEIREIFAMMGFAEISGSMVQPCFWNFDALLTPQDHPSREMQDTFYLGDDVAYEKIDSQNNHIKHISKTHTRTWHQKWDVSEAKKAVLRTHTTCVTLRHLQELAQRGAKDTDARMFSLGRVFRNEKTSYKHLAEFTQVEGVVHEKGAGIRDLMGIQAEFYRRLGLPKVKFWPTFFPYTEPSFQSMVYNEKVGKWVELFGMGIFHPHVTRGLPHPVLAWGGGVERIAMLKYGVDDVREFYANNMKWLRSARPVCR